MAGGLVSQALKMAVLIYIARAYGATEFGAFSFAYSINAFLYVISQFGLGTFATREVAQTGRFDPQLFKSVSEARLLLAFLGAIVALGILSVIPQVTRSELYLVAGFGLSNAALAGLSDWAFQGIGKLHGWAALNITWQAAWLLFTVVAVRKSAPIQAISLAYAAAALLASLTGWVWWRRRTNQTSGLSQVRYTFSGVLSEGTHLGTGTILQTFLVWVDIVVVRLLVGPHGAGLYAAGNRIALGLGMLAGFYMQGAFPQLARAASESQPAFQRVFRQTYTSISSIFVPGAVFGVFYAPEILNLVYKRPEYSSAVPVFQIFQMILILTTIGIVLYGLGVLLAFRQDRTYRQSLAVASVAYLLLCPFFTWRWGIIGAAIAALLVQVLLFVLFEIRIRAFVDPKHTEALSQPLLLGLAAGGLPWLLHQSLFSALIFLAVAYSILSARQFRILGFSLKGVSGSKLV